MKDIRYKLFNFFTFATIAAINSQLIPLLNESVGDSAKAWVLGISAIAALIGAILIGYVSDHKGLIKQSYLLVNALLMISAAGALFIQNAFFAICIFMILMIALVRNTMSIAENWIYQLYSDDFGRMHCFAAAGLIAGSLCSGMIRQSYGNLYFYLFVLFCSLLSMILAKGMETLKAVKTNAFSKIFKLFQVPAYQKLLLILFILMLCGFADSYVAVDKLLEMNVDSRIVSIKFAIQSLMEIPIYYYSVKLFKKYSPEKVLFFASVMTLIKFLGYSLATNVMQLLLAASLQLFTHPLIVLSSKILISNTAKEMRSSAQIVGFAIYFGMSGFLTPLITFWLKNYFSYDMILFIFALISISAIYLMHRWYKYFNQS